MRMALVDPAGVVVGLVDWDIAKTFTPPEGHLLRVTQGAKVGDVWAAGGYVPGGVDADNRALLLAKARAYLALPAPSQAQTTKVVRALLKLAVDDLEDLTGT